MGLDVRIEDENGNSVAEFLDNDGELARVLASLVTQQQPLLSGIDVYADTIFNRRQVVEVMKELEQVAQSVNAVQRARLHEIQVMIRERLTDSHLYLRFVGD
jgi:hypothetical protein